MSQHQLTGEFDTLLAVVKLVTVLAGFFIVALAWRAYRGRRDRTILWMGLGIAVLTLGAISEGLAFQGLGWTIDQSHVFEALVTLAGFGILVYSLVAR